MSPGKSLIATMAAGLAPRVRAQAQVLQAVPSGGGWFGMIRESFSGAFQQHVTVDAQRSILAFSAVFSCVTLIAADIAKLGIDLMVEDDAGISAEVEVNSPWLPLLEKPNNFQIWLKFIEQWIVSKLLYGNAYILKGRDARGVVNAMYVLDAQRVKPLVALNGDVYYELMADHLSGLVETVTVPASEIIHDTMVSLWHPLVGVSPIYACGVSATMGNRIQANSTHFFSNGSRPSGILTAPGSISDPDATEMKARWEANYSGQNIGRTAVLGNGLTYVSMGLAADVMQLIEQLKWTVEDVARCFHVPMWKLGDKEPLRTSVESLNQTYYSDCLQALIESAEALLDVGLALPSNYHVEFDLDNLMRMDTAARFTAKGIAVKDGWMKPNEARAGEDMQPVDGGDACYLQQQNYSLAALAKRDALPDPFASSKLAPAAPASGGSDQAANDAQAVAGAKGFSDSLKFKFMQARIDDLERANAA